MAVRVEQIHDRIWQIFAPFGGGSRLVLLYLVKGGRYVLVDTGTAQHPKTVLEPALNCLGLELKDVGEVLITHGHHDHTGGNGVFKQEVPDVKFFVHPDDRPFCESREHHATYSTVFLHAYGRPDLIPARTAGFEKTFSLGGGVDGLLNDGDNIDLGDGVVLTTIHTPGHTLGSVCFYWETEKLLISGDAVQGRGSYGGSWPLYNHADEYHASIERLLSMPIEIIGLGHPSHSTLYLNTPVKYGAEAKAMLDECLGVAQAIRKAARARVQANPQGDNLELAQGVVQDLLTRIPTLLEAQLKLPSGGAATILGEILVAKAALTAAG